MNQEDKELLLKDLCSRLPYHPIVYGKNGYAKNKGHLTIVTSSGCTIMALTGSTIHYFFEEVKPYLRPMSSMTEEEREELSHYENPVQRTDFYYSHHIDCRFLIEKGLALEAPDGMYNLDNK